MLNVLNDKSNGAEMDEAWKWKDVGELARTQGKEFGESPRRERREWRDFERGDARL